MIQLDSDQYWLLAAVDSETNEFLHDGLFPTRNTVLTKRFVQALTDKHGVETGPFLIDSTPWPKAAFHEFNRRLQTEPHCDRNAIERISKERNHRTKQFANHFKRAESVTAESWLHTFPFAWNHLLRTVPRRGERTLLKLVYVAIHEQW